MNLRDVLGEAVRNDLRVSGFPYETLTLVRDRMKLYRMGDNPMFYLEHEAFSTINVALSAGDPGDL